MKYKVGDRLLVIKIDKKTPDYTPVGEFFIVEDVSDQFYWDESTNIVCSEDEVIGPEIYNTKLFKAIR